MHSLKSITTTLIITLLLSFSGFASATIDVNLKTASGVENLGAAGYQQKTVFKLLIHQGEIGFSYGDASGSPVVTKSAGSRAKQMHSALDPRAQRMRTTAVTETQEGVRVISSSNRRLSPAQRAQLGKNEVEGVGIGHAEVTGVNAARNMGLNPTGTAASRPICPSCARTLAGEGVNPLSPLK